MGKSIKAKQVIEGVTTQALDPIITISLGTRKESKMFTLDVQ